MKYTAYGKAHRLIGLSLLLLFLDRRWPLLLRPEGQGAQLHQAAAAATAEEQQQQQTAQVRKTFDLYRSTTVQHSTLSTYMKDARKTSALK